MHIGFIGEPTVGNWTDSYCHNVVSEFIKRGHLVTCLKMKVDDNWGIPHPDVFLLMGDTDYNYQDWLDLAEKIEVPVFGHHHGGPELFGFCDWPQQEEFYQQFGRDIDRFAGIFFNTEHSARAFWYFYHEFDIMKLHVVGFPIHDDEFRFLDITKKEDLIVVPGRLANDRQPLFSMKVLYPIREHVIFAAGANPTVHNSDGPEKEYLNTLTQAGFKVGYYTGKDYSDLLKRAQIVFSASLRDTLNTSVVEAMFAGCIPVVPDMEPFDSYVDAECRYPVYDLNKAFAKVAIFNSTGHTSQFENIKKFERKEVVSRMVDIMQQKTS